LAPFQEKARAITNRGAHEVVFWFSVLFVDRNPNSRIPLADRFSERLEQSISMGTIPGRNTPKV